jgi:Spy/CpxP family protein refolding chaperone
VKDRSLAMFRLPLSLLLAGIVAALPLTGCSGKSSAPDSTTGSGMQGSAGSGPAAGTGGNPAAGRRRMAQALMGLGLSDDQKTQIREIMRSTRKESVNADPETRRANYKAAFAKIDELLTPDQRVKLHARLGTMRGGRGQGATSQS